jgi:hypothetical protein
MGRRRLIVLFLILCGTSFSQSSKVGRYYIQKNPWHYYTGTLLTSVTYAPSVMLNRANTNLNLTVFSELHIDRKFSLRGDLMVHHKSISKEPLINSAIRGHLGLLYHFVKVRKPYRPNWDGYIGYQVGATSMSVNDYSAEGEVSFVSKNTVRPTSAFILGTSYYVTDHINLYVNVSYKMLTLRGALDHSIKMDELFCVAGVGFHFKTPYRGYVNYEWRKKVSDRRKARKEKKAE